MKKYITFVCQCGKSFKVRSDHALNRVNKSCGCIPQVFPIKHGDARRGKMSYLYRLYLLAKNRCNNPNSDCYHNYGGRGIKFLFKSYVDFKEYILTTLGERPKGLTLDRKKNNGHYKKGNLRWATRKEQSNNRRISK